MHADSLKQLLDTTPFVPFKLKTVTVARYTIDHPDFALMTRGGRTLIVNTPDGAGERVHLVDTAVIERTETSDSSLAS